MTAFTSEFVGAYARAAPAEGGPVPPPASASISFASASSSAGDTTGKSYCSLDHAAAASSAEVGSRATDRSRSRSASSSAATSIEAIAARAASTSVIARRSDEVPSQRLLVARENFILGRSKTGM